MKKLLWVAWLPLLMLSTQLQANPQEALVDTGQWQISVALGYGSKSNPLAGGDDLNLFVLPDIAYYGEAFYFDNGDFGYTFHETERFSFSAITRLNSHRAYFSFLHPANILIPQGSEGQVNGDGSGTPDENPQFRPLVDDIAGRKFAIDSGLQLNVHFDDGNMLRAELMQDISGVYKGQNAMVEYLARFNSGELRLSGGVGLSWHSGNLVDYYYGIDSTDNVSSVYFYQGKAAINPFVKLSASYPLSAQWRWVALGRWTKLAAGMTDSPLVSQQTTSTLFTGVSYAF